MHFEMRKSKKLFAQERVNVPDLFPMAWFAPVSLQLGISLDNDGIHWIMTEGTAHYWTVCIPTAQ